MDGSLPDGITQNPSGTFNFGNVNTATTPPTFIYRLTGENLTSQQVTLASSDLAAFAISATGLMPQPDGSLILTPTDGSLSQEITITFTPTNGATNTGTITHSGGGLVDADNLILNLEGSGISPSLGATPSSLNFVNVNTASTPTTMTYDLIGANLTEDVTLVIGGTHASLFDITSPTVPITPADDGSLNQQITVTFNPDVAGNSFEAMITHSSNGLTSVVVDLRGSAVSPSLTFAVDGSLPDGITQNPSGTFNFGNVNTATTPPTFIYRLTGENLTSQQVTLASSDLAAFAISATGLMPQPDGSLILTPTDGSLSQEITITFTPTNGATNTGTITHSGGGLVGVDNLILNLEGSGISPSLGATPSSLNFVNVNTASTTTNEMTYDLTGANLTGNVALVIEGTHASLFDITSPTVPITPADDGSLNQQITVTFNPDVAGNSFEAMITHSSNGLTPVVVNLTGSAVSPSLTLTVDGSLPDGITQNPSGTFDFGGVNTVGSTPSISFTVTGENLIETDGTMLNIAQTGLSLDTSMPMPLQVTLPSPLPTINSGEVTLTFVATFDPSTTDELVGTITFRGPTSTTPEVVLTLKGQGVVPSLQADPNPLDFGDLRIDSAPGRITYDLTGENLTTDVVTLVIGGADESLFTISPTEITPANGAVNETITVTFDPDVAGNSFIAMITHSGGGLTTPVVVNLAGTGTAALINVTNLEQLNAIRYDLDGDGVADDVSDEAAYGDAAFLGLAAGTYSGYELMVNLDFDATSSYASSTINMDWTTVSGWEPIGDSGSKFRATFEGNGHTISNLFINRSSSDVGLFGYSGSTAELLSLGMVNVEVTGGSNVGGLVGSNEGTVSNSYAIGSVTGTGNQVGGLIGSNQDEVSNSYAMGSVTGSQSVGGLVGLGEGAISNSYATGAVTGTQYIGGLVGFNFGSIVSSYATGLAVSGLVGLNFNVITASYYTDVDLKTPTGSTGIYETWDAVWDFGTDAQYPVLKLDVNGDGTVGDATDLQLQRLRLIVTPSSLDFEEVNTVSTATNEMTYNLTGENLIEDVTLAIEGAPIGIFTINTTSPIVQSSGTVSQMITVTFAPAAAQAYSATISHNGGGLVPAVVNLMGNAVSPSLTFAVVGSLPDGITQDPPGTGTTFDFGRVNIASSVTFTYMLTGINLTDEVTLTSSNSAFTISVTTPLTPTDGSLSQEITVTFDPDSEQSYTGMITHSGGGLADDLVLNLNGEGVNPTLMFSPAISTHDFDQVNTATTPPTFTYTLTGENLTSEQVTLTSSDPAVFAISSPTNPLTPNLDGSLSEVITVTFDPVAARDYSGTITHSGGGLKGEDNLILNLNGEGVVPTLMFPTTISGNTHDFGQVNTATTPPTTFAYMLTGENLTDENVTLVIEGTDASLFTIISPTDPITPVNGVVGETITVTFEPDVAGNSFEAMITHSGGGLIDDLVLNLNGSGISPSLTFAAQDPLPNGITQNPSGTFDFGEVNTDLTRSINFTVTGENLIEANGTILGIAPTGVLSLDGSSTPLQVSVTTATIMSGEIILSFVATFKPTTSTIGESVGTITFGGTTSTAQKVAGVQPVVLTLKGTGVVPSLEATPSSLDFMNVNTASTTTNEMTYNLTGANLIGDVALAIEGTHASLFAITSPTGLITPADGVIDETITVTFDPTVAGNSFTGKITHSSNGLTPVEVDLTGSAVSPSLTFVANTPLPVGITQDPSGTFDFGNVNTSLTRSIIFTVTGENLTGDVTLATGGTNPEGFTISPTDLSQSGGTVSQEITVTFNPTARQGYSGGITHSGGGLEEDALVLNLKGRGTRPPKDVDIDDDGLIEIYNIEELNNIRYNLAGTSATTEASTTNDTGCPTGGCNGYELMQNLDFSDPNNYASGTVNDDFRPSGADPATATNAGFPPIGGSFTGTFEGNGFQIHNLYVNISGDAGLFADLRAGTIRNLGIVNAYITSTTQSAGGLVGQQTGLSSQITNCYATGTGTVTGNTHAGGLVGSQTGSSSQITNCYATANVEGSDNAGGLVGSQSGDSSQITNCYATGTVTGATNIGGLVGELNDPSASITASYWDATTSAITNGVGIVSDGTSDVTSRTTLEMHALTATSTAWNSYDWNFGSTSQYPALRSYKTNDSDMQIEGDIICAQPTPRVQCTPTWRLTDTSGSPINSFDFGNVSIAADPPTLTYILIGENLTQDVVLMSADADFIISSTGTLTPTDGILNTEITVTFRPTTIRGYSGTITHSGGGLINDLVLNLSGTAISPTDVDLDDDGLIEIYNIEGLNNIRNDLAGTSVTIVIAGTPTINNAGCPTSGCNGYELMQNLDFSDPNSYASGTVNNDFRPDGGDPATATNAGFPPIGGSFTGTFEGNGFQIHNLYVNTSGNAGLFAGIGQGATGGTIRNLGIVDAYITSTTQSAGGLVGQQAGNSSQVTNCYATGSVTGNENAGGLVGWQSGGAGKVTNCYATANVTGTTNAGGLVGKQGGAVNQITNCYATGMVTGATNIGGLVGERILQRPSITASYWDTTASTITDGDGVGANNPNNDPPGTESTTFKVTKLNTIEMYALTDDPTTSTGWSLNDWNFGSTSQYPALRSYKTDSDMQVEGDIICAQPLPRVQCSPIWRLTDTSGSTTSSLDFGDASVAADPPTLTYILVGENLTQDVVLMSSGNGFTISVNTLVSIDRKINQEVTVTFDPVAAQDYSGTITHSSSEFSSSLTLNGKGIIAPTLMVEATLPGGITESPENTFNFDKVNIASSVNFTYMLTGLNLTDEQITLTSSNSAFIISLTDLTPELDGALSQMITVTFDPDSEQTYMGTITHSGGGLADDLVLNLNGTGVDPTLMFPTTISGNTHDFGQVNTATTSPTFTYMLTGEKLTSQQVTLTSSDPAFAISATGLMPQSDGSLILTPAANGSLGQGITITFTPTNGATNTGTITHSGGGLVDDLVLNLEGSGISPSLTFAAQDPLPVGITESPPGTFNFGEVNTASTSSIITYDLTGENLTGEVTLAIDGAPTDIFTIDPPGPLTLANGVSETITVTFNPTDAQEYTATITHSGGGLVNDLVLILRGRAVSPSLTFAANTPLPVGITEIPAGTFDFGEVNTASTRSISFTVTGENLTENVTLAIEGTNAGLFSLDNTTPPLSDGTISGTTVTVTFNPDVAGDPFTAMFTHTGGGLTTPVVVNLTGSAVSPSLTFAVDGSLPDGITQDPPGTGTTFDFGEVNTASTSSMMTYNLTGTNLIGEVTLAIEGAPTGIFTINTTGSLTPADGTVNATITVTFDPDVAQEYNAMITHSSNGLASDFILNFNGEGVDPTLMFQQQSLEIPMTLAK